MYMCIYDGHYNMTVYVSLNIILVDLVQKINVQKKCMYIIMIASNYNILFTVCLNTWLLLESNAPVMKPRACLLSA